MAKPIEPTPVLTGRDAQRFIEKMIDKERSGPSRRDREIAKAIEDFSRSRSQG